MIQASLTAVVFPLVLGALLCALAGFVRSRRGRESAIVLAAGAALVASSGPPALPPHDAVDWAVWLGALAAVLGAAAALVRTGPVARACALLVLSLGAAWLVLEPLVPHALATGDAPLALTTGALVLLALTAPGFVFEPHRDRPFSRVPTTIACAGAVLAIGFSSSIHLAELAAALLGSVAGVFGVQALRTRKRPSVSLAPLPGLVLGTLLLGAWAYADLAPLPGVLLVACAACVWLDGSDRRITIARTGVALLLASAAVFLAYRAAADRWHGLI